MLIPVPEKGIWLEIVFRYEHFIDVSSVDQLSLIVLKEGRCTGIYEDDMIRPRVQGMIDQLEGAGTPRKEIVDRVSKAFGVPAASVDQMALVEDLRRGMDLMDNGPATGLCHYN